MRNDKPNIIVDKTIAFSLAIIKYCSILELHKKYVIANQLLRSSTSIGANVSEAQNAESKSDFIHKIKIAAKEASEVKYWLILCEKSEGYFFEDQLQIMNDEIIKILSKIISSAKNNLSTLIFCIFAFSNFQIFKLSY